MRRLRLAATLACGATASIAVLAGMVQAHSASPHLGASGAGHYPSLGGCPTFPTPSVGPGAPGLATEAAWNQDISKAPVAGDSASVIAYIDGHGADHLHPDFGSPRSYGFPYAVVAGAQRKLPIHYTAYGDESDPGPFPIPPNAPIEGGQHSNGDRHVLVVDRSTCTLYELGRAFYRAKPHPHWNADAGARWDLRSAARRPDSRTSADAAGLPIFPGLVRYDEVASGHIHHAIRVTFDSTRDAWVHPGSHCAGDTSSAAAPPMGLRLRLKAGYSLAKFTGAAKVIATALKRYGLIVADNGSNWYFGGTSDPRWNDQNLDQLKRIPGSAFQVIRSRAAIHRC